MRQLPDANRRNQAVWDAWERTNGNSVAERAREYFPPEKYRTVPGVCYFYEHATKSRDGTPVRYGLKELADIVDEHNARSDHDNYSAISDGHTLDGIAAIQFKPQVLGYVSNYRLGMIGNDSPKYAIFADEHHEADSIPVLDKKRRRSVEVNRFRDGRRPYFDPVAALGAESPRLALPVARYESDDGEVERYSMVAPVSVGANSTYIPGAAPIKDRHSPMPTPESGNMDPTQSPAGDSGSQGDLVSQIIQAIQSTPELRFVRQMMQSQGGGQDPAAQGGPPGQMGSPMGGSPGQQPGASPPAQPGANPEQQQYAFPVAAMAAGAAGSMIGNALTDRNSHTSYALENNDVDNVTIEKYAELQDSFREFTDKYALMEEAQRQNLETIKTQQNAIRDLQTRNIDSERRERLKDLYSRFPGVVDFNEECERCLYSAGNDMNADLFEKHLAMVEKYAERASVATPMLPRGEVGGDSVERYSESEIERAVDRCTASGGTLSYEAALAEIRAGR